MTINRRGNTPKNCSLGKYEDIFPHLKEFYKIKYKGNRKLMKELKDDWRHFLKVDGLLDGRYLKQFILNLILDDPLKFQNLTLNRHTIFPIPKKTTK